MWSENGYSSLDLAIHGIRAGRVVGALSEELEYFCDCALNGTAADYLPFDDAIHGLEVIEATIASASRNRDVSIAH
jgi:UDP-N-acetylglucosamine 3-dehydrogenase